ncbi:TadE-like protein [Caulifigura coniformis]|uniref:TadE-like protein n=1 Tax=Caulifigura coniformis TaxID=2527983 RepID=A0A517S9N4_9PLAN|nr:TadE/TadG family type IV pilus assembly protein [Caulifigura coniformis]QDT52838.1 TadE-like protein [Caulifigura coniformis]
MKARRVPIERRDDHRGATIVETAIVLPVFLTFLFGVIEFGHAFMCNATLTAAAKDAARYGSVDGVTSQQVIDRVKARINGAFKSSKATVLLKDAATYELTTTNPSTVNVSNLPNIELSTTDSRHLFIVRVTVPYDQIAIMPPFWARGLTLHGDSVMRHE